MRTTGLHLPDSSSIFANMGFKGNSAILMPRGSVRRQSLSRPAIRTTKGRRHEPLCWKMYSCWENKRWYMLAKVYPGDESYTTSLNLIAVTVEKEKISSELLNIQVWKINSSNGLYCLPWLLSRKESTCQCRRCGFDPWVGKIPWRKKWQPTPVFSPGKSHGQRSWWATVHGVAKSWDMS